MTTSDLAVTVTMLSDWHVGTGRGLPGPVDATVVRDQSGLPFLPAKSLTGIWRDGCETLVHGLDAGQAGVWHRWLEYLFGSQPALDGSPGDGRPPRPAAVRIGPARLPASLRDGIQRWGQDSLRLTFIKPGVCIDQRSGRAKDKHLRFVEMARRGLPLVAPVTLTESGDSRLDEIAKALLAASVALVTAVGGKRRRGAGACEMRLFGLPVEQAATTLKDILDAGPPPEPPTPTAPPVMSVSTNRIPVSPGTANWIRVPLNIDLRQPVIAARQVVGNVTESHSIIPGALLLPVVLERLRGLLGQKVLNTALADGRLRVLDAVPRIGKHRGRPVPSCLEALKHDGGLDTQGTVFNSFHDKPPDRDGRILPTRPLRGLFVGPVELRGDKVAGYPSFIDAPAKIVRTHNIVDDLAQRPLGAEDGGVGPGVYSLEAIKPDIPLLSELRIHGSLLDGSAPDWWRALSGPAAVGRARKDDYGGIDITAEAPMRIDPPSRLRRSDGVLAVWLLSLTQLRGHGLAVTSDFGSLAAEVEAALARHGVRAEVKVADGDRVSALRLDRRDGWFGSGLPRPSVIGFRAGSCALLKVTVLDGDLDAALDAIELDGIGDRRAEGCGEAVFDDPLVTGRVAGAEAGKGLEFTPALFDEKPFGEALQKAEDAVSISVNALMNAQFWGYRIQCHAAEAVRWEFLREKWGCHIENGRSVPSLSQLGGIRSRTTMLGNYSSGREELLEYLLDLEKLDTLFKLTGALRSFAQNRDEVFEVLSLDGVQVELRDTLWGPAVASLCAALTRIQGELEAGGPS